MNRWSLAAFFFSLLMATPYLRAQGRTEIQATKMRLVQEDPQGAAKHWYSRNHPSDLPDMDAALNMLLPLARPLSAKVTDFQTWEVAQDFKAYHGAGAILLANAYNYLYRGDVENATPAIELIEKEFPFAMTMDSKRRVLRVREALRYHEHCCMLYAAMSLRVVGEIHFPKERDEFDGMGQRKALEHMATLRLREGNIDRLEHFFAAINHSGLQTSGGDWAIDIIMDAMRPLDTERDSPKAWQQIQAGIQLWQKHKPTSIFAQVAEARFIFNHAVFKSRRQGAAADVKMQEEVRADALRGLEILEKVPRTSPVWYDTMLRVQCISGLPVATLAPTFQEGLSKYPDYTPLAVALGQGLILGGDIGQDICVRVFEELQANGKGGLAAQTLRKILFTGGFPKVKAKLNPQILGQIIRDAVARWPDSYELRSDLGLIAVMMENHELARDIMRGMQGKWCRESWRGREELAVELTETSPPVATRSVGTTL